MKEFPKFAAPLLFLPELQIFFFLPGYISRGHVMNFFQIFPDTKNTERVVLQQCWAALRKVFTKKRKILSFILGGLGDYEPCYLHRHKNLVGVSALGI